MRVPLSPYLVQLWLSDFFFFFLVTLAILMGVIWNLGAVICIALIAKDVEHFLRDLVAIFISSTENSLFRDIA